MRTEIIKTFVTVNKSNENTKGNSVESLSTKHATITFLDLDKINISLKQPNTVVYRIVYLSAGNNQRCLSSTQPCGSLMSVKIVVRQQWSSFGLLIFQMIYVLTIVNNHLRSTHSIKHQLSDQFPFLQSR